MFTDVGMLSAVAAAILASICWIPTIERLDVGHAYRFMALSFVLIAVGSTLTVAESSNTGHGTHYQGRHLGRT